MKNEARKAMNKAWEGLYTSRDPGYLLRGSKDETGFWVVTPDGAFHLTVDKMNLKVREEE